MADLSAAALCISISTLSLAKLMDKEISVSFMVTFNWESSSLERDVILFSSSVDQQQIDYSDQIKISIMTAIPHIASL